MLLLAQYTRNIFCIPATSANSERLFSASGQIVSDRRKPSRPRKCGHDCQRSTEFEKNSTEENHTEN